MCAPVTVTTGGASGGCVGVCQVVPQIIGLSALAGVLLWNFRGLLRKGFTKINR